MNRWVLGVLALAAVGLGVTVLRNRPAAGPAPPPGPVVARGSEPPEAPPVVDVIDLALELDLAPAKGEPFVPFD